MTAGGLGLKAFVLLVVVAIVAILLDRHYNMNCHFDSQNQIERMKRLESDLSKEMFGQQVAVEAVLNALHAHVTTKPRKALVMAFHGPVGTGKTHMSHLIASHLYDGGFQSSYVYPFIGPMNFELDKSRLRKNQELLRRTIENAAKSCGRSLFIFDEVDKMPPEIFDVIVPFIDHHVSVDGVDYRGLSFIFLSNTGAKSIIETTDRLRKEGKTREEITLLDFRQLIARDVFTEQGGLRNADMIKKRLVDYYIPFLPLEKEHVIRCAKRDIAKKQVLYVLPEYIASKVVYVPQDNPIFAEDGCKSVPTFVDFEIRKAQMA